MSQVRASAEPAPAGCAQLWLKRSAHAARVGDDLVLLDVEGDRYLCLPAAAAEAQLGPGRRSLLAGPELAKSLPTDLTAAAPEFAALPPAPPRSDISTCTARRPSARDWARLALCYADYWRLFAGRPFSRIVAQVRRGGGGDRSGDAVAAAAMFAHLVVWLPVSGQCLVRSFLLMRFLLRSGADAQWVFGVRTWPFGAHCWVQAGGVALDDHTERVAGYVPVMAV